MNKERVDTDQPVGDPSELERTYPLPKYEREITLRASEASDVLIKDPGAIIQFRKVAEDRWFLAETSGEVASIEMLRSYLKHVGRNLRDYRWDRERETVLSTAGARAILEALPLLPQDKQPPSPGKELDRITEELAAGYINKRFAHNAGSEKAWRSSFWTLNTFIKGAALSRDPTILQKYFDLVMCKYERALPVGSTGWRSIYLAERISDPDEEELYMAGIALSMQIGTIARIINSRSERRQLDERYSEMALQFNAAVEASYNGIDLTKPSLGIYYRNYIINAGRNLNLRSFYGNDLNYEQIARQGVPPDILGVASQARQFPERTRLMTNARVEADKNVDPAGTLFMSSIDSEYRVQFPYTAYHQQTEVSEKLKGMLGVGGIKEDLYKAAQKTASIHGNWRIAPFSQRGLTGYLVYDKKILSGEDIPTSKETVVIIDRLIVINSLEEEWNKAKALLENSSVVSTDIGGPEFIFMLTKSEYSTKTSFESLLDLLVPEKYERNAIAMLREATKARSQIPADFTQMPTLAGDRYKLEKHPDLPGVIKEAVIVKRAAGGISFEMKLIPCLEIVPEEPSPTITGTVSFPNNRAEIVFDPKTAQLPIHYRWLFENIALNLLRHTCCVPLNELEGLEQIVELLPDAEQEKKDISIPGRVVHVGGRRPSGEVKQYTQLAEGFFLDAMRELGFATDGLSLAVRNKEHQERLPWCGRWLTWNRGFEPEVTPPPTLKQSPEQLLPNVE